MPVLVVPPPRAALPRLAAGVLARARRSGPSQVASVLLLVAFAVGDLLRGGPEQVPALDLGAYNGVYLLAALPCLASRPRAGGMLLPWRLVGVALVTSVLANISFSLSGSAEDGTGDATGGAPSAFDVLYLVAYLASCSAVLLAVRARTGRFLTTIRWDAVVTGAGAAAVLLCLPAAQRFAPAGTDPDWAALAYPVADLAQLSLLAGALVALQASGDRVLLVAGIGLAGISAGDVIFLLQRLGGDYAEGGLADTLDLLGVVLIGFAARARDRLPAADGEHRRDLGWPVLVLPGAATVGSVLLLVSPTRGNPVARWLAAACVLAALVRMVLTLREISDLGRVHREARTDELTGLPNRRAFAEECDLVVPAATAATPAALVLLDLDRFKQVNDSLGHAAGDELLAQVAARLRAGLPPGAVAARLSGDEFAVLLPDRSEPQALAVATAVAQALADTFTLERVAVRVSTSIGVACAPQSARTPSELLRCADVAMYAAKAGAGSPTAFSAVRAVDAAGYRRLADELRRALSPDPGGGRLVVHLQPQVHLDGGAVVGLEALVRWEHPEFGLVPPGSFLAAAQSAGLMGAVTGQVLEQSLAACRQWRDAGHALPVSVNVSAAGLHDAALPATVAAGLRRHALPAQALVVELTEDSLMTHPERARGVLEELRGVGVGVSIDDYGTGYSSLAYLRQLPVDEIKLDRALVQDLSCDRTATAIVRHTVDLAHALGLRLVVEGIEDDATMAAVRSLGADVAQGFRVARPMPVPQVLEWLAGRRRQQPAPPVARAAPVPARSPATVPRPQPVEP